MDEKRLFKLLTALSRIENGESRILNVQDAEEAEQEGFVEAVDGPLKFALTTRGRDELKRLKEDAKS